MLSENDLWPEQRQAIRFIYERDNWLLLADVGTGKTVMVLTALHYWFTDGVADRVLVLAPTRVCQQVWRQEVDQWEHLQELVGGIANLAGRPEAERRKAIERGYPVLLLNYEQLVWFMRNYPDAAGCNVLICDEVDKLKGHKTARFKGAKKLDDDGNVIDEHIGMKDYRDNFEVIGGMTGTPTPNHLLDLWAQAYIVDGGKRLDDSYWDFRKEFFYPEHSFSGFANWKPFADTPQLIEDAIADITFRIEAEGLPGERPEVLHLPPRWLGLPKATQRAYRRMEKDYITSFEDENGNLRNVSAADAAGRYGKLRQIAQGFAYVSDDHKTVLQASPHKYLELDRLVSELQGQQLMIVYHFIEQQKDLARRFKKRIRFLGGGVGSAQAARTIQAWNQGELELLGVHPQSAGHGLNLQKSGAHHIAMLTLPESAGAYAQVVGRLARTSNPSKRVFVHKLLTSATVDVERLEAVEGKITSQSQMLSRMKARQV